MTKEISEMDFTSLVPQETFSFIQNYFSYKEMDNLEVNSNLLSFPYISEKYRAIICMLKAISELDPEARKILEKNNVKFKKKNIKNYYPTNIDSESERFKLFTNYSYYYVLTPYRIISNYMKHNRTEIIDELVNLIDFEPQNYNNIIDELDKLDQKTIESLNSEYYNDYFRNVPIEVVSYLDTVGKIYNYLQYSPDVKEKIKTIKLSKENIKAVATLMALFMYEDVKEEPNVKEIFLENFEKVGLTKEKIETVLNINFDMEKIEQEVEKTYPTLTLLHEFAEFSHTKTLTVDYIFKRIIHEGSNEYVPFQTILTKCKIDDNVLNDIYQQIEEQTENTIVINQEEFYQDLSPDTIKYLNNTYQIYMYLSNIYKEKEVDRIILQNEKELLTLAILISSYTRDGYVSTYFKDNNITLKKIENLLDFKMNFDEIKQIKIDENAIIKLYSKYINQSNLNKNDLDFYDKLITSYDNTQNRLLNRIFYSFTQTTLPDNFLNTIQNFNEKKEEEKEKELFNEFFLDLDTSIYEYLRKASYIYASIDYNQRLEFENKEKATISLLLAYLGYTDPGDIVYQYLSSKKIYTTTITDYFNCYDDFKMADNNNNPLNIYIVSEQFGEFVFDGINKNKEKSEITITSILENVLSKELNNSFLLKYFLSTQTTAKYEDFKDLDKKAQEYYEKKQHDIKKSRMDILKSQVVKTYENLKKAAKIYTYLKENNIETININNKTVNIKDCMLEISVLISILQSDSPYKKYFFNRCETLENTIPTFNITNTEINDITIYDIFSETINDIIGRDNTYGYEHYHSKDEASAFRRIKNRQILKEIFGPSSKKIFEEVYQNKIIEDPLTREEVLAKLEKKPEISINSDDMDAALDFVLQNDDLTEYSKFINEELKKINSNSSGEESLKQIDVLVEKIYEDKETAKISFLSRLFNSKNQIEARKVNHGVIVSLSQELDNHIEILKKEILEYQFIAKCINAYLNTIDLHYEKLNSVLEEFQTTKMSLAEKEENYSKTLHYSMLTEVLIDKLNSYEKTKVLMKREQFSVYQTILNHFMTINALKTSKNDILPLIESEVFINMGKKSEINALELSNSLIALFHSVIEKNAEGTKQNLEILKKSSIPENALKEITTDLDKYLTEITSSEKNLETKETSKTLQKKKEDKNGTQF